MLSARYNMTGPAIRQPWAVTFAANLFPATRSRRMINVPGRTGGNVGVGHTSAHRICGYG
jgi:hypothetical protein